MADASDEAEFVIKVIGDFTEFDAGMKARTGIGDATFGSPIGAGGGGSIGGMSSGGGLNSSRLVDSLDALTRALQSFSGTGNTVGTVSGRATRRRAATSDVPDEFDVETAGAIAAGQAFEATRLQRQRGLMGLPDYSGDRSNLPAIGRPIPAGWGAGSWTQQSGGSGRAIPPGWGAGSWTQGQMDDGSGGGNGSVPGWSDAWGNPWSTGGGGGGNGGTGGGGQGGASNALARAGGAGNFGGTGRVNIPNAIPAQQLNIPNAPGTGGGSFWNQNLTYFNRFLAIEGVRTVTEFAATGRQHQINQAMALGDQSKLALADVQYRKDIAASMPLGVGRLAEFIRDPAGQQELGVRLPIALATTQGAADLARGAQIHSNTEAFREAMIAHTPAGPLRQLAELKAERLRAADAANIPAKAASEAADALHKSQLAELENRYALKGGLLRGLASATVVGGNGADTITGQAAQRKAEIGAIDDQYAHARTAITDTKTHTINSVNAAIDAQVLDVNFGQMQQWQSLRVQERSSRLRATAFGNQRYTNERQAAIEDVIGASQSDSRAFHHAGDDRSAALRNQIGQNQIQEMQTRMVNSLQLAGTGFGQPFGPSNPNTTDDITGAFKQFQKAGQRIKLDPLGVEEPGMLKDIQGNKSLQAEIVDGLRAIVTKLSYLVAGD